LLELWDFSYRALFVPLLPCILELNGSMQQLVSGDLPRLIAAAEPRIQ